MWNSRRFRKIAKKRPLASSCLSARNEQLGSHSPDFHEIWYWKIFRKSAEKIQVSLKSYKKNCYFSWRPIFVFDHTSLSFIVEPCIDKISVNSNQIMHIFIKKHIRII